MDVILTEVDRALNACFFYLAVANCLGLPDICAAMESADGETTGNRYKTWYDKWMAAAYQEITSVDMYSLRCGVIHQGVMTHRKMQYDRIVFGIPDVRSVYIHRMVTLYGGLQVLMIDEDVDAAQRLFEAKKRGDTKAFHFKLRRKDGSAIWADVQGTPLRNAAGVFNGIVDTFSISTEQNIKAPINPIGRFS
jgi:hypothetical protein